MTTVAKLMTILCSFTWVTILVYCLNPVWQECFVVSVELYNKVDALCDCYVGQIEGRVGTLRIEGVPTTYMGL